MEELVYDLLDESIWYLKLTGFKDELMEDNDNQSNIIAMRTG